MRISPEAILLFMFRNCAFILLGSIVLMLMIGNAWFYLEVP